MQASGADKLYSAADLMKIAVNAGTVVSVAHDNRLPRPGWLAAQFQPTGLALTIGGNPMQVFQHAAVREESVTLGANAESGGVQDCNMYVVFVSPPASR